MPLFYFVLKGSRLTIPDRDGIELPDIEAARTHAVVVARELMRNRELSARQWRMEVCDDYLLPCFDIVFAEVDSTIDHLTPRQRRAVETMARRAGLLQEAFGQVQTTLQGVRDTFAEADRLMSRVWPTRAGP